VEDASQPAFVDELLGQRHRRHPAIIERDQVGHAGFLHRVHHFLGLRGVQRQRLFTTDGLAGLGGGDGDLGVHVVRHADVHHVDILIAFECVRAMNP